MQNLLCIDYEKILLLSTVIFRGDYRVFLFLNTDDFWRDYERMQSVGIEFVRDPQEQDYGTVAVFKDLYGNLWDLLQLNLEHPMAKRQA
ncbi:MAG: hypothetical protein SPiBPW_14380 [Shewanella algae]